MTRSVTVRGAACVMVMALALLQTGCFSAPPQIVSLSPTQGSGDVAADAPVRVAFDHAVVRASVRDRFHVDPPLPGCDLRRAFDAAAQAPCRIVWSADSSSFTLEHAGALFQPATHYTLAIDAGVVDEAGSVNGLAHLWGLLSAPAPTLASTTPADGAVDVPADVPLVVSFSTAMAGAPTAEAITLAPPLPGTRVVQNSRDPSRFVVLPGRLLDRGVAYTLRVTTEAADAGGQHLPRGAVVHFQAGAVSPGGHALVLGQRSDGITSELLLAALGPAQAGEPAPAPLLLASPLCEAPPCGAVTGPEAPTVALLDVAGSSDGRWAAVVEQDLTVAGRPVDLRLLSLARGGEREVAAGGWAPSWSPDGRRLAYGAPDGVHVADPTTLTDIRVAAGVALDAPAVWSADGAELALPILRTDGTRAVELADTVLRLHYPVPGLPSGATRPVLAPDGSELAVLRYADDGTPEAWTIPLGGSSAVPRRIGGGITPVAYLDAGTLLVLQGGADPGLVRINLGSGDRTRLAAPQDSVVRGAAARPSGRQVAYLAADGAGTVQAYVENADGSNSVPLTDFPAPLDLPSGAVAGSHVEAVAVAFSG